MAIESVRLVNFRGFTDTTVELHPQLTLLIGPNGSGKSTVVDALSALAGACGFGGVDQRLYEGVRAGADRAELSWVDEGAPVAHLEWERGKDRHVGASYSASWPVFLHREPTLPREWQGAWAQTAFTDFRRLENLENEKRLREDPTFRVPVLEAARHRFARFASALSDVPGFPVDPHVSRVDPDGRPWDGWPDGAFAFVKDGGVLTTSQLSDGERALVGLALALAMQCGRFDGPRGLVLLDEVELHLHPGWQRRVLPALLAAFPELQFVATTHSPQVVGSVDAEMVRVLDGFRTFAAGTTKGRDSNSLLVDVFGVPERDGAVVERIEALARAIDAEDYLDARAQLDALREELTADDPELVRLGTLLEFMAS